MQQAQYTVSVPGSIMLLGEHAVLHGHRALACAINQRIFAKLCPVKSDVITLQSNQFGTYTTHLNNISIKAPFQFVLAAIKQHQLQLPMGFKLSIDAEFPSRLGLGSSAAVTIATMTLLKHWLEPKTSILSLAFFKQCLDVVHKVQNRVGSGSDIAASIWGGVVSIKTKPLAIEKLPTKKLPLTLIYSGNKTLTTYVIQQVLKQKEKYPALTNAILNAIGECAEIGYQALLNDDLNKMAEIFAIAQALMQALNVSNEKLEAIIKELTQDPGILGVKISGAGLGDCVVGLGQVNNAEIWQQSYWISHGIYPLTIEMSDQGILYGNS